MPTIETRALKAQGYTTRSITALGSAWLRCGTRNNSINYLIPKSATLSLGDPFQLFILGML
jgi:hypothetical protein